jgi:hypothetical protein
MPGRSGPSLRAGARWDQGPLTSALRQADPARVVGNKHSATGLLGDAAVTPQVTQPLSEGGTPVSASTVRKDIRAAYREIIGENREDMIARQRSVLFDFQRANYFDAIDTDPAKSEQRVAAQKLILSAMDHEAKLFGLYSPTHVSLGISDTEFAEETAKLISELGLQPPKNLTRAISASAAPRHHRRRVHCHRRSTGAGHCPRRGSTGAGSARR